MHDEMERARTRLEITGAPKPFFIQYQLVDIDVREIVASFGAILVRNGKIAGVGQDLTAPAGIKVIDATGMQVSSAVLAGMVWALENPTAGIVEADEMDFRRCLEIQMPYLGPVKGYYTDWTPLTDRPGLFPEDIDTSDPWQFRNVLVR